MSALTVDAVLTSCNFVVYTCMSEYVYMCVCVYVQTHIVINNV